MKARTTSRFCFRLVLLPLVLIGCSPAKPGVTSVKLSPTQIPATAVPIYAKSPYGFSNGGGRNNTNIVPIYADSHYGFYTVRRGSEADVLVAKTDKNLLGEQWKRIAEVSLTNAKLGHNPRTAEIYWDFSKSYRNKAYAPLPLRSGSDGLSGQFIFLPDKIEFDAKRSVYLIWFNTAGTTDKSVPTKLEIWKNDLDEAFKTQ